MGHWAEVEGRRHRAQSKGQRVGTRDRSNRLHRPQETRHRVKCTKAPEHGHSVAAAQRPSPHAGGQQEVTMHRRLKKKWSGGRLKPWSPGAQGRRHVTKDTGQRVQCRGTGPPQARSTPTLRRSIFAKLVGVGGWGGLRGQTLESTLQNEPQDGADHLESYVVAQLQHQPHSGHPSLETQG